ncbi:MAG: SufE family protein [Tepidisphaeraceae bacterium]
MKYPEPAADSVDAAAAELLENFELFESPEERYAYVIELGEKIPPMPDELKTELTRVHGCMSVVHLHARRRPGTADKIDFIADSDGHIVRGLIAILQTLFAGQSSREILGFDVETFLTKLGLGGQLSQQRRTGFAGMVSRLRAHANQFITVS